MLTYLKVCKEAGLEPRIFPIRFVEWVDDDGCEVRAALAPFQYKDLSNWRHESDPTQRSKLIYEFASGAGLATRRDAGATSSRCTTSSANS